MLAGFGEQARRLYDRNAQARGLVVDVDGVLLGPDCPRAAVAVSLRGLGATYLDAQFATMVQQFDRNLQQDGIVVRFTSGYRSDEAQGALRGDPSAIAPARYSLHSSGLAIDIDFKRFDGVRQAQILEDARDAGLTWGGSFRRQDVVHFFYDPYPGLTPAQAIIARQQLAHNFALAVEELKGF